MTNSGCKNCGCKKKCLSTAQSVFQKSNVAVVSLVNAELLPGSQSPPPVPIAVEPLPFTCVTPPGTIVVNRLSSTAWVYKVINGQLYMITCAHNILDNDGLTLPITYDSVIVVLIGTAVTNTGIRDVQDRCTLVAIDVSADIAILRTVSNFYSPCFPTLSFAPTPDPGADCYVVGNPANLNDTSIAAGNVRDPSFVVDITNYTNHLPNLMQTAAVDVGSSGSPVLDCNADVMSMIQWKQASGGFSGGVNSDFLQPIVEKLFSLMQQNILSNGVAVFNGSTGKGYLGIVNYAPYANLKLEILRLTYPLLQVKGYDQPGGYIIQCLYPNMPNGTGLANAGLMPGDVILKVGQYTIGLFDNNTDWLLKDVYFSVGKKITVTYLRPSIAQVFTVNVIVGQYPADLEVVSEDIPTFQLINDDSGATEVAGKALEAISDAASEF
jgi:S1-C subfamily serine protease